MQYTLTQLSLQVFSSFFIASISQLIFNYRVAALRLPVSLPILTHMSSGKMFFNTNFLLINTLYIPPSPPPAEAEGNRAAPGYISFKDDWGINEIN